MKKKIWNIIFWVIMIALAAVFAFNGTQFLQKYFDYSNAEKEYSALKQYGPVFTNPPKVTANPNHTGEPTQIQTTGLNVDALKKINPEFVAWITIPGTNIDYPMVQTNDNTFYLQHSFKKERNSTGAIFLDYRMSGDFLARNTIIYGHHMRNDTMFAQLNLFKNQYFSQLHPSVFIDTAGKRMRYEYFASYLLPGNKDVLKADFLDDASFSSYLKQIQSIASYHPNVKVTAKDRILTLVTCTYEYEDARFVAHFRLVPN